MQVSTKVSLVTLVTCLLAFTAIRYLDASLSSLTRGILLMIITLNLCHLAWLRHRFVVRFNQISPRAVTFGIIGHLRDLSSCLRGNSVSAGIHEVITSLDLICANDQSGLMSFFLGPVHVMIASSPETVQAVLTHKNTQEKGPHYNLVRYAIGDGLTLSSGERWSQHRKLLTPAFHFRMLKSLVSIVRSKTQVLMSRVEADPTKADYQTLISDFALSVLCESSMGRMTQEDISHFLKQAYEAFAVITFSPWMWPRCLLKLYSTGREYIYWTHQITRIAEQVIRQRIDLWRSGSVDNHDGQDDCISKIKKADLFIDIMIRKHIENASYFSLRDIVDETNIFLIAGHDTTSLGITYTFILLGHHPQVQARVHEEIDSFFTDHSDDDLTPETLKNFHYLDAVIRETFRLYPPIPIISRVAKGDIEINGQNIPKGTEIAISVSLLHMNPKHWPHPHRFNPERFLEEDHHPFAFLPFSAGPRNCIGQKYAMIQMKSFIILMLKHHTVESITQLFDIIPRFAPTLTPLQPLEMKFIKR